MMFRLIFLLMANLLMSEACLATIVPEFLTALGGSGTDEAFSIVESTQSSGFVVAGRTDGFGVQVTDMFVSHVDVNGVVQWSKTYGWTKYDFAFSIVESTQSSGYVIAGHTDGLGAGLFDTFLLHVNASGEQIWGKTYGGPNNDYAFGVVESTQTDGYTFVGYTSSIGGGSDNAFVIHVNPLGTYRWTRIFAGPAHEYAYKVIESIQSSGFVVVGHTNSFSSGGDFDVFLLHVEIDGVLRWSKAYQGTDAGSSVVECSQSAGYLIVGSTLNESQRDLLALHVSVDGSVLWAKTYGGSRDDSGSSVVLEVLSGGFLVTGQSKSFSTTGTNEPFIIRLNSAGLLLWSKTYASGAAAVGRSVVRIKNPPGFAVAGHSTNFILSKGLDQSSSWTCWSPQSSVTERDYTSNVASSTIGFASQGWSGIYVYNVVFNEREPQVTINYPCLPPTPSPSHSASSSASASVTPSSSPSSSPTLSVTPSQTSTSSSSSTASPSWSPSSSSSSSSSNMCIESVVKQCKEHDRSHGMDPDKSGCSNGECTENNHACLATGTNDEYCCKHKCTQPPVCYTASFSCKEDMTRCDYIEPIQNVSCADKNRKKGAGNLIHGLCALDSDNRGYCEFCALPDENAETLVDCKDPASGKCDSDDGTWSYESCSIVCGADTVCCPLNCSDWETQKRHVPPCYDFTQFVCPRGQNASCQYTVPDKQPQSKKCWSKQLYKDGVCDDVGRCVVCKEACLHPPECRTAKLAFCNPNTRECVYAPMDDGAPCVFLGISGAATCYNGACDSTVAMAIFGGVSAVVFVVAGLSVWQYLSRKGEKAMRELEMQFLHKDPLADAIPLSEVSKIKLIGMGAFGKVHSALYKDDLVALKELQMDITMFSERERESFLSDLLRESELMKPLRHSNIVSFIGIVFDIDENGNRRLHGMLQELCEQGSLADLVYSPKHFPRMDLQMKSSVAMDIIRGIAFLHARNIAHRDLKCENVLMDRAFCAKIADFGLSKSDINDIACDSLLSEMETETEEGWHEMKKVSGKSKKTVSFAVKEEEEDVEASLKQRLLPDSHASSNAPAANAVEENTGNGRINAFVSQFHTGLVGTPGYRAPELIKILRVESKVQEGDSGASKHHSGKYTLKVDIYAYGMILYELITGQRPWTDCATTWEVRDRVSRGERPVLPDDEKICPQQWRELIEACWHQNPAQRPSARDVILTLSKNFAMKDYSVLFLANAAPEP